MMLLTGRSNLETLVTADLLGKDSMWYARKNFYDCYYLSAIIWNWNIVFLFSEEINVRIIEIKLLIEK
jgi:hypothetical protein